MKSSRVWCATRLTKLKVQWLEPFSCFFFFMIMQISPDHQFRCCVASVSEWVHGKVRLTRKKMAGIERGNSREIGRSNRVSFLWVVTSIRWPVSPSPYTSVGRGLRILSEKSMGRRRRCHGSFWLVASPQREKWNLPNFRKAAIKAA